MDGSEKRPGLLPAWGRRDETPFSQLFRKPGGAHPEGRFQLVPDWDSGRVRAEVRLVALVAFVLSVILGAWVWDSIASEAVQMDGSVGGVPVVESDGAQAFFVSRPDGSTVTVERYEGETDEEFLNRIMEAVTARKES